MILNKLIKNIVELCFTEKSWVGDYGRAASNRVAAGDPAKGVHPGENDGSIPKLIECDGCQVNTENFLQFIVDGDSMLPEGISSGDTLLCDPVEPEVLSAKDKKFVVIKVDEEYYKYKGKDLKFDYKLRRTLYKVPVNPDFNSFISELKKFEDSVLLKENEKSLKEKFEDVYKFYPSNKEMMLSITYRDGKLRYSFHPVELITYVAKYLVKRNNDTYKVIEL